MRLLATPLLCISLIATMHAQVLTDVMDRNWDESYHGFAPNNWDDAAVVGLVNHAGTQAFLSYLGGPTTPDVSMVKPLGGTIAAGPYRVSFYYTRYFDGTAIPASTYDTLYIGTPSGSMMWDSVPDPVVEGEWVKWSGVFTPDPGDIGQPFSFGFGMDMPSGSSFGIDGPLTIIDLTTMSVPEAQGLHITTYPGMKQVSINVPFPIQQLIVNDAAGRTVGYTGHRIEQGWILSTVGMPAGFYSVMVLGLDGTKASGRFWVTR